MSTPRRAFFGQRSKCCIRWASFRGHFRGHNDISLTNTKPGFSKQPASKRLRTRLEILTGLHNTSQLGSTNNRLNLAKPIREEFIS